MQLSPWFANQLRRPGTKTAIEYSLVAGLIIAAMIMNLRSIGTDLSTIFTNVVFALH